MGVSVVHQNLGLVDDHAVWENVRLGRYQARGPFRKINSRAERDSVAGCWPGWAGPSCLRAGRDPGAEDRATIAIARAMQDYHAGSGLIIFDESTRALRKLARAQFFELVRALIDAGASVLLISHQLEEIVEATDRVTGAP